MAEVIAVCISRKKGTVKKETDIITLEKDWGIVGDAHAGKWHRQVSLLAKESVNKIQAKDFEIKNGDFAENILTQGIIVKDLPIGTKIKINDVILEITQIGKTCHESCEIKKRIGLCIMPLEGVFAKVIEGGSIKKGDNIEIIA